MCTLPIVFDAQFSDAEIACFHSCATKKGLPGDPCGTLYKQPFVNTCGNPDYRVIQKCEKDTEFCVNCDAHRYVVHRHSTDINSAIKKIINKHNNKDKIIKNGDVCMEYTELSPNALDAHFKQNLIQIGGAKLEEHFKKNSDDPLQVHHIIPKKNFDCTRPEHRDICFGLDNIILLRTSMHKMVHSEKYKYCNTYDKIIRMISEQYGIRSSLQMEPIVKTEVIIVKPDVPISSVVDRTDLSTLDDNALNQWMQDQTQKVYSEIEKRERLERERLERERLERIDIYNNDIQRRKAEIDRQYANQLAALPSLEEWLADTRSTSF
jgi:hypothetical protein